MEKFIEAKEELKKIIKNDLDNVNSISIRTEDELTFIKVFVFDMKYLVNYPGEINGVKIVYSLVDSE